MKRLNLQVFSSADYWRKREEENLKSNLKQEKEYDKELERIYKDMLDAVQKEIDAFYGKYAKQEGITLAEARKRVSQLDIEAYERKAKRYVNDPDSDKFSKRANEEMRIYNLTMKVNRLEMLKANIGLELIKGHSKLETFMSKILRGRTEAELERQAGILGKTIRGNAKLANSIVNASFKNATFSDRIWMYHDQMKSDLSKLLQSGMIQGKGARQLAKDLRKYYYGPEYLKNGKNGAVYNTERLMRTELARVQTEAQRQTFEKYGFKEYTFLALGDACDICKAIDGKHFKIKDMMPGENAPPIHPHCRCSISAYEDTEEYEAWLDFLDKGGTTADWNKFGKAAWMASIAPKTLENSGRSSIMKANKETTRNLLPRKMSNGLRTSPAHVLTEKEIRLVKEAAKEIGLPVSLLRYNQGIRTGFRDSTREINVRGDVLPDLASNNPRDNMSVKAVLAHEYYGHYKMFPSKFDVDDWRDEFAASYRAAIDTPNLSSQDRAALMIDAYERAKEAGVSVTYNERARRIIYGY